MRQRNKISYQARDNALLACHYVETSPIYQKGDDFTCNIEDADKTALGVPIQITSNPKYHVPHSCYKPSKPLSFNPKFPQIRQLALEARAQMNMHIESNIYFDKIDAAQYSNNCLDAIKSKVESLNNLEHGK